MKLKTIIRVAMVAAVGILLGIVVLHQVVVWYYEKQEQQARSLVLSLVPRLKAIKQNTGHYPAQLPTDWLPSHLPTVIDAKRLYRSDGNEFRFTFNCYSQFWDDKWEYTSLDTNWSCYDDNEWGASRRSNKALVAQ